MVQNDFVEELCLRTVLIFLKQVLPEVSFEFQNIASFWHRYLQKNLPWMSNI